jgi:hypothetical protein
MKLRELGSGLGWIVLLFAFWLAGSILDLSKYLPHKVWAFAALGFFGILAVVASLRWVQKGKGNRQLGWGWFAASWALVAILHMIVFPMAQRKADRNDSYDGMLVSSAQLLHLHFPYYVRSFKGAPITPMPGALLLALPFQILGSVSLQNLFWLGIFMWFAAQFFRFRSTAFAFILVTVLASARTLVDILVGADYPINWMYICISTVLFLNSSKGPLRWKYVASGILLGVALSSRPTYALVLSPLILAYLSQQVGVMAGLRRIALPLSVTVAVTLPFYLYDPAHFTPFHVTDRLAFLPERLQHPVVVLLIVLAVVTACTGFLIRLTLPRLFLLAGVASAALLVPPGLILALGPNTSFLLLGYSSASACFLSLWAFRRMEDEFSVQGAGFTLPQPAEQ